MMTANINRFLVSALPVLGLAIAGCGTTDIITTDPGARIVVDGVLVGRGQGEITQTGLPESSTVAVVSEDGRRETRVIHRRFTGTTLLLGMFTDGICLIACWQYPDTVFMPLPGGAPTAYGQGAPACYDPWRQPPATCWQPSSPGPPPPDSTAPGPAATLGPASQPSAPSRPASLEEEKAAVVVAASAAVRSAPFKVAPAIAVLPKGKVLLVDATSNAGWRFVPLKDGRAGYIEDAQLKMDSP
jgi:hypothetical protein